MKKLFFLMGMALIVFASCNKETDDAQNEMAKSPKSNEKSATVISWTQFTPAYKTVTLSGVITFPSMNKINIVSTGGGKIVYAMTGGTKYRVTYTRIDGSKVAIPNSGIPPQLRQTAGGSITVNGTTVNANSPFEFNGSEVTFNGGGESNGWVEVIGLLFERCIGTGSHWEVFTPAVILAPQGNVTFPTNFMINMITSGSGKIEYIMTGGSKYRFTYSNIVASKVAIPNSGIPPQLRQTAGGSVSVAGNTISPNTPVEFIGSNVTFNGGGEANSWVELQGAVFERYK